ncbi:MAG: hypothetical protein IJN82_03525 [Clostridia bacterium]|nr:hypothetical protein [Clostridia bacterium]
MDAFYTQLLLIGAIALVAVVGIFTYRTVLSEMEQTERRAENGAQQRPVNVRRNIRSRNEEETRHDESASTL